MTPSKHGMLEIAMPYPHRVPEIAGILDLEVPSSVKGIKASIQVDPRHLSQGPKSSSLFVHRLPPHDNLMFDNSWRVLHDFLP